MPDLPTHPIRFADLRQRKATAFAVEVNGAERAAIVDALDLSDLRKLRFTGRLEPIGAQDWTLHGSLGATVVQPCVVTLDPVTTRIDETILRRYVADFAMPESGEVEMPEDDTTEPLPGTLDLATVMIEALSLALPDFPRADGAALGDVNVTEPGKAAMTDDDAKPFAGLSALRDQLTSDDGGET